MANDPDEELNTDQRIRRSAARLFFNGLAVLGSLAVIGLWLLTGVYYNEPGESAVVLVLGRYHDTVTIPGWRWRLPAPLGFVKRVNVSEIRHLEFGGAEAIQVEGAGKVGSTEEKIAKNSVQTADSNIVIPSYVVQYTVMDPFTYLYAIQDPERTLHDATQAAMREVIGQHPIDSVFSSDRVRIQREAKEVLIETLTRYVGGDPERSPFAIRDVQLQSVRPPPAVQDAFDDVVSAKQDLVRSVSVAEGDALEIREKAQAEAREKVEFATAYKKARVLEAEGEASRFDAMLAEYSVAKEVTRRRLYIEAMEDVLPTVEKIVIDEDTVQMLPMWQLQNRNRGGAAQ